MIGARLSSLVNLAGSLLKNTTSGLSSASIKNGANRVLDDASFSNRGVPYKIPAFCRKDVAQHSDSSGHGTLLTIEKIHPLLTEMICLGPCGGLPARED